MRAVTSRIFVYNLPKIIYSEKLKSVLKILVFYHLSEALFSRIFKIPKAKRLVNIKYTSVSVFMLFDLIWAFATARISPDFYKTFKISM